MSKYNRSKKGPPEMPKHWTWGEIAFVKEKVGVAKLRTENRGIEKRIICEQRKALIGRKTRKTVLKGLF